MSANEVIWKRSVPDWSAYEVLIGHIPGKNREVVIKESGHGFERYHIVLVRKAKDGSDRVLKRAKTNLRSGSPSGASIARYDEKARDLEWYGAGYAIEIAEKMLMGRGR